MYHGLRQYEALHRLWWFFFIVLCLLIARYSHQFTHVPRQGAELKDVGKVSFWTGLKGIGMSAAKTEASKGNLEDKGSNAREGKSTDHDKQNQTRGQSRVQSDSSDNMELIRETLLFLVRAGTVFLELRILWLLIQYAGRYLLQAFMSVHSNSGKLNFEQGRATPESLLPFQVLFARVNRSPLSFVFHPFMRLKLILSGFQNYFSSEELFEKERRVVDSDWSILYGSWGPYRCLFWVLPILGLAQTVLLFITQFNAAASSLALVAQKDALDAAKPLLGFGSQKEILDALKPTLNLLLPLIQAAGLALFFQLASTLLRNLEGFYLSNLDAFIYDRLLSKLPVKSNDTILILESLQQRFKALESALDRLDKKLPATINVERQT